MKVKELIKLLKKENQENEVKLYNDEGWDMITCWEDIISVDSQMVINEEGVEKEETHIS